MNGVKKRVLSVVGTRPNFMKAVPLEMQLSRHAHIDHTIVHTGQHFDANMSDQFFVDLELRPPDLHLGVSGGTVGDQSGRMMVALDQALCTTKPDLVVVLGDVNSTFAGAYVAKQHHLPVAHIEAGLRSYDRTMPEEINRVCTDAISDLLFTPHPIGDVNLEKEGVAKDRIHMVGDIMIDCLTAFRSRAEGRDIWTRWKLPQRGYGLVTLHRPANVDDQEQLARLGDTLMQASERLPLVFPVHPRTRKNLADSTLLDRLKRCDNLHLVEPLGYLDFLNLLLNARVVFTDSGSIQLESSCIGVPCLTLRENTERPFCISDGTNHLVGRDGAVILATLDQVLQQTQQEQMAIDGCDGRAAERIAACLSEMLG